MNLWNPKTLFQIIFVAFMTGFALGDGGIRLKDFFSYYKTLFFVVNSEEKIKKKEKEDFKLCPPEVC